MAIAGVILIKVIVVFTVLLILAAYMTWMERRVFALVQVRVGPNRVGPAGLLQPIADGIKLMFKETLIPADANKIIFILAPALTLIPALSSIAVIPFGDKVEIFGYQIDLFLADVNIGILYIFALSGLGVYGIVLGSWSSNSKYPLLGGLRSAAQLISYELSLGLSLLGVVMLSETLSLKGIVDAQSEIPFIILQPLGFVLFVICMLAETNRAPFDLPEAESELTGGFHTEYSSMHFAVYFLAEYCNMITLSAVGAPSFLGGWRGPFLPPVVWFLIKVIAFMFFFMWLRATTPRLRYDQLMDFGWKILLPVSILNAIVTAGAITFFNL